MHAGIQPPPLRIEPPIGEHMEKIPPLQASARDGINLFFFNFFLIFSCLSEPVCTASRRTESRIIWIGFDVPRDLQSLGNKPYDCSGTLR
jgi:hypothetical protein